MPRSTDYGDGSHVEPIPVREANAHLIAAAPELLAALISFVRMDMQTHEIGGGQWSAAIVMARAAVARAEGRQP